MNVVGAYLQSFKQRAAPATVSMAKLGWRPQALLAYKDWFPAALAVTIAFATGQNLAAALFVAQAWMVGRANVFQAFLTTVFYLAVSLVAGPSVALALLLLEQQKPISHEGTDESTKTLAQYVETYRFTATNQALAFLANCVQSERKDD